MTEILRDSRGLVDRADHTLAYEPEATSALVEGTWARESAASLPTWILGHDGDLLALVLLHLPDGQPTFQPFGYLAAADAWLPLAPARSLIEAQINAADWLLAPWEDAC